MTASRGCCPFFCSSLMGKSTKSWFLLFLESGGHPEYITAILLLSFSQARVRKGRKPRNVFWNDSLTLYCPVACGLKTRQDTYLNTFPMLPLLMLLTAIFKSQNITHYFYFNDLQKPNPSNFNHGVNKCCFVRVFFSYRNTPIDLEPNVWTKWWCTVAMIMISICCVLGGDTWIFNCVC